MAAVRRAEADCQQDIGNVEHGQAVGKHQAERRSNGADAADRIDLAVAELVDERAHAETADNVADRVDRHANGGRVERVARVRNENGEAGVADDVHGREQAVAEEQVPVAAGPERLAGRQALELRGCELGIVRLGLPASRGIAHRGGLETDGRADADDDDRAADDVERDDDADAADELDDQGREEGGGAAVKGHAQAGGKTALVGVPAGRAVGAAGVREADAETLQDAEGDVQHPGGAGGDHAGQQEREAQQDAAEDERFLGADLAEQPAAEDVAGRLHEGHVGGDAGNGFRRPAEVLCHRGDENGRGVDDAAHGEHDQGTYQNTCAIRCFDCLVHIFLLISP